jgi:hypothetical protein
VSSEALPRVAPHRSPSDQGPETPPQTALPVAGFSLGRSLAELAICRYFIGYAVRSQREVYQAPVVARYSGRAPIASEQLRRPTKKQPEAAAAAQFDLSERKRLALRERAR